jgi:hypothetical protein
MTDLRKAAEMALGVLLDPKTRADEVADAVQTLRQALAQTEKGNSSPNYPITEFNTSLDKIVETAIQGHAGTRDAIRWAIQQEREACAQLCEEIAEDLREEGRPVVAGLRVAAKEIRARGEK